MAELKHSEDCTDINDDKAILCVPQEHITRGLMRENYSHDVVRGTNTTIDTITHKTDTNVASGGSLMTNSWDGEGRAVKEKEGSTDVNAFQESLSYGTDSLHKVTSSGRLENV